MTASATADLQQSGPMDVLACPDCGLVQSSAPLGRNAQALCMRCGSTLAREHKDPVTGALIWTITALLLAFPAMLEPVFIVSAAGIVHQSRVDGTVIALLSTGFSPLAVAVGCFSILIPVLWLSGLLVFLTCLKSGYRPGWLGPLFRYVTELDIWGMPDVFVVGGFVAYTRLQAMTRVAIGIGGWSYLAFAFAVVIIRIVIDRHFLWQEVMPDPQTTPPGLAVICPHCAMLLPEDAESRRCPRCGASVHIRKPASLLRCGALIAGAYLLYIPANLLPVLNVTRFGRQENATIMGGAMELIHAGMWPLAAIVFMASIFVPVLKLLGLSWFLVSIKLDDKERLLTRTRLYRLINVIGRWSNIDVFMIGLLAALVNFGNLATIRPEPGALAFAAVVMLTMFASHAFDSRLMWDRAGQRNVG